MAFEQALPTENDLASTFARALSLLKAAPITRAQLDEASELLNVASQAGHSKATELRALFDAMGVGRPQSWERALDMLQLAAEQGSRPAREQLLVLSNSSAGTPDRERDPCEPWVQTRQAISLEQLMRHRERRALSDAPRIRTIEAFASSSECRWLIERARARLKPAPVIDALGKQIVDPVRTSKGTAFELLDMDVVIEVIRARISAAIHIPVTVFEPTQVLNYCVGEEFKLHVDFLESDNPQHQRQIESQGQRIATFLIYLNADFGGGCTEFPRIGVNYRGRAGDAIFWANCDIEGRPDPMTLHAGLPPTRGEKWVLSQWIRDRVPSAC